MSEISKNFRGSKNEKEENILGNFVLSFKYRETTLNNQKLYFLKSED